MKQLAYVVITPVRDEAGYIDKTIDSMVQQTILPQKWILVDDGSTDRTSEIIDIASKQHTWIDVIHRLDRGFRKPGGGVIESFDEGYCKIDTLDWDFLVKLDGDLSFTTTYFEESLGCFARNPSLGIGGGTVCVLDNGRLRVESPSDPPFHVRGATKIYRRECWKRISPLAIAPGWDTLDELKANMLGWKTYSFPEIKLIQHRITGSADGTWNNYFKNGRANYITGYHPLFMLAKCIKRLFDQPYFIASFALAAGFISGYWKRCTQNPDKELCFYIRRQQLRALIFMKSLWS